MEILVCDDDKAIVDAIGIYLSTEGYNIHKAFNGMEALECLNDNKVDLMITDVMMPGIDGISLTNTVRQSSNIPIIMLSAKVEHSDRVLGLNVGADDYVTKPFDAVELIARVKSQLRRYYHLGSSTSKGTYQTGGLVLDDQKKLVTVDGEPVKMTPIEFNILKLFMGHLDQVFSIDQIYENVWNERAVSVDNTIAVHIRRIREKIEINPKNPKYLKVVWGIGYKIQKY